MPDSKAWTLYPRSGNDANLQSAGSLTSALSRYLAMLSSDNVVAHHEFDGALDTNRWTTNAGTGATAFAEPATLLYGGVVTAATGTNGTAGNRRINLYGRPIYSGAKNCIVEYRFKISNPVDIVFECGWLDTMTTITTAAPACTDIDGTPTFAGGAGDAAIVVLDTTQTLTTMALATLGSGALNAGARQNLGTTVPTSATYMTVRVGLIGTTVIADVDRGDVIGTSRVVQSAGMASATLVRPWVFVGGGSATSRTVDLDYVRILGNR